MMLRRVSALCNVHTSLSWSIKKKHLLPLSGKRPGLDDARTPTPPHRTQHAPFRCTTLSKSPFARFSVWLICHVRQFKAVILSAMDFSVTYFTDRDLFSVEHP